MADEVLESRQHVALIAKIAVALEASNGGNAEAGDKVGIFAVGLLDAAPTRFTGDIDDRREGMMRAAEASFERSHGEELLDQLRIEGGAERDGLREAGAIGRGMPVEALFVKDDGNAEARVLEEELLDGVGELGHLAGVAAAAGVGGTAHLAEAAATAEGFLRLRLIELALFVDEFLSLFLPDAEHLGGFFLEAHAGK